VKEDRDNPLERRSRLPDVWRHVGLLFILALLVFNWPILTVPFSQGLFTAFLWLVGLWLLFIVLLYAAARWLGSSRRPERRRR
jgi:phosphoglycerol transferase MdoB-like AlkP superfamily enzyme